jgi:hypothetical protein
VADVKIKQPDGTWRSLIGPTGSQGIQGIQGIQGAAGPTSLISASANLAANVTMTNANQFYDGPVLALTAGTWIVFAVLTAGRAATTATSYTARISDGTTHYASTQFYQASLNPHVVTLALVSPPIVLVTPTTLKAQCVANVAASIIYAAATVNGAGNNASHIRALKIA